MNNLKRNADLWQELAEIGYFTGKMPDNLDDIPDDIFVNIHKYLCQECEEHDETF